MLDTTNYDKLRSLKDLSYSDHDVYVLRSGKDAVVALREKLETASVQMAHAMEGEALTAAQQSLSRLGEELAEKERLIDAFIGHHERARESMRRAIAAYDELPHRLVDSTTEHVLQAEARIFLDGKYVTPDAYLTVLKEQANREREAAAAAALSTMDTEITAHTANLVNETGSVEDRTGFDTGQTHNFGSTSPLAALGTAAGAAALTASRRTLFGSVVSPSGRDTTPHSGASGNPQGVYHRPPASGPGSRYEPVNDPDTLRHLDLYRTPINPRMSSDGSIGGYLPAHVTDGTDPRWSSQQSHPIPGSSRASLSAGMLLAGGGAAAMGRSALVNQQGAASPNAGSPTFGAPAFGSGRTSSNGVQTAASMSGLRGSTNMPTSFSATSAGQSVGGGTAHANPSSAGAALRPTATAFHSPTSPGVPGTAGAPATPGAPGAPGTPGAYAPGTAATGTSADQKKAKDRIGYQVVRVRDDKPRPVKLSEGAGPGSAATMKPLRVEREDDTWE